MFDNKYIRSIQTIILAAAVSFGLSGCFTMMVQEELGGKTRYKKTVYGVVEEDRLLSFSRTQEDDRFVIIGEKFIYVSDYPFAITKRDLLDPLAVADLKRLVVTSEEKGPDGRGDALYLTVSSTHHSSPSFFNGIYFYGGIEMRQRLEPNEIAKFKATRWSVYETEQPYAENIAFLRGRIYRVAPEESKRLRAQAKKFSKPYPIKILGKVGEKQETEKNNLGRAALLPFALVADAATAPLQALGALFLENTVIKQ